MGFGFFKNVVDTDNFDFDLSLDAETLGAPCYSGGFEMNFDLRDELKLAGIYLQGSHSVFGSEDDSSDRINESSLTAGKWLSVSEKAQVLLQYDSSHNFDEREYSRGLTVWLPAYARIFRAQAGTLPLTGKNNVGLKLDNVEFLWIAVRTLRRR